MTKLQDGITDDRSVRVGDVLQVGTSESPRNSDLYTVELIFDNTSEITFKLRTFEDDNEVLGRYGHMTFYKIFKSLKINNWRDKLMVSLK